jgi:hypothetical protein
LSYANLQFIDWPMPRNIDELKICIRQAVETVTVDMLHRVLVTCKYYQVMLLQS